MNAYGVARVPLGADIGHGRHNTSRGVSAGGFDYHPVQPDWPAELAQVASAARVHNGGS